MGAVDDAIVELGSAHTAVEAYGEAMETLQAWALGLPGRMTHEGVRWGTPRLDRAIQRVAEEAGKLDPSKLAQAIAAAKVEAEKVPRS